MSAIAKPWEVQHSIAKLVADEFFDQGDLEKLQLNTKPIAMMDRERKDELPKMQVGFIDVICMPLYKVLSETFPWIAPLYEGTMENRQHWQDLAEKVEMGLTWIDHDTIDQPIEELAGKCQSIYREFLENSWILFSFAKTISLYRLKHLSSSLSLANAIDRGDIEFTVCELNCHNAQQDDQGSPVHERKPRFSSFKKSSALSKAVRSKLYLSKSSTEKQNSCGENNSFEHEKADAAGNENGKDTFDQSSASSSSSKSHPNKVMKKKSKLCLLLWPKQYSEDHV